MPGPEMRLEMLQNGFLLASWWRFQRWAQKCSKNGVLKVSWGHFPCWAQTCSKLVSSRPPGHIFRAGRRNAPKRCPGNLLGKFSALGPEMFKNSVLEGSWGHFPCWAQKCSKMVSWRLLTGIFRMQFSVVV